MKIHDILPPQKKRNGKKVNEIEEVVVKAKESLEKFYYKKPKRSKILIVFVLLLFVGGILSLLNLAFGEKQQLANFYPKHCEGTWQNPENAVGPPEVLNTGSIESFSEENSAVYKTGPEEFTCSAFKEISQLQKEEQPDICGKDNENCKLVSPKIYLSFAIDNLNERENSYSILKENQAQPSLTKEISTSIENNQSSSDIDTKLIIWYSTDNGTTWQILRKITTLPLSNYLNGNYFSFDAPFLQDWSDIKKLKIKLEGTVGGEENIVLCVDSVWVETKVRDKNSISLKEKIFSLFQAGSIKSYPEKIEVIKEEFKYEIPEDGKIVASVKDSEEGKGGLFRIWFYSQKEGLVNTLYLFAGETKEIPHILDLPESLTSIDSSFLLSKVSERKVEMSVKRAWGKVIIKAEYIPFTGEKMTFDSVELEFFPEEINFRNSPKIGTVSFEAQEKAKTVFNFKNNNSSNLIFKIIEKGGGGSGYFIYLDGVGVGLFDTSFESVYSLLDIPPGEHQLVVSHIDTKWDDNKGKRTMEIYFNENTN